MEVLIFLFYRANTKSKANPPTIIISDDDIIIKYAFWFSSETDPILKIKKDQIEKVIPQIDWKMNEEIIKNAVRAFTLERALLARAGRSRALEETLAPHFKLPCKQDGTLVEAEKFYQLMDEYYSARGWDLELGWPKEETLKALGMDDVIAELNTLRQSIK